MARKKKATKSKKATVTTRSKDTPLHQDSEEDEEQEQEETKEASVEQEEQEEDNNDDDDDEENENDNVDDSKKKSNRRTKPRGLGYTQEETETLLSCIHEVIPIGPQDWENVLTKHSEHFPDTERDVASIRRKYNKLQSARIPTGDPNCPPLVRQAKRIHRDIEEKMDAQEELNEEELGFPPSDVEDSIAVASPAVASRTVSEAVNSPALFRRAKRAKIEPQGISSKVDGLLSVLVTKMVQDQDRAEEIRRERQQQQRNENRRNDMMTMMMMTMMSTMMPTQLQTQMNQMMNNGTNEEGNEDADKETNEEANKETNEGKEQETNEEADSSNKN